MINTFTVTIDYNGTQKTIKTKARILRDIQYGNEEKEILIRHFEILECDETINKNEVFDILDEYHSLITEK